MQPDVLMLAYAAFAGLAMAMKRHRPMSGNGIALSPRALRLGGAALLAFSYLVMLHRIGPGQGAVAWVGSISLAAILLVLLMSWRPTAAFVLAVPAITLAALFSPISSTLPVGSGVKTLGEDGISTGKAGEAVGLLFVVAPG